MKITSEELKNKINSGESFIVDLYADWCGPCRMMSPIIDTVSKRFKDEGYNLNIYKFNIEEDKNMAAELGVRSIPNIKFFKNGEVVLNKVGMLSESQLMEMSKEIL